MTTADAPVSGRIQVVAAGKILTVEVSSFQITKQNRRFVEFADAVRRHSYIGAWYDAPGLGKTLPARTYAAADD